MTLVIFQPINLSINLEKRINMEIILQGKFRKFIV